MSRPGLLRRKAMRSVPWTGAKGKVCPQKTPAQCEEVTCRAGA